MDKTEARKKIINDAISKHGLELSNYDGGVVEESPKPSEPRTWFEGWVHAWGRLKVDPDDEHGKEVYLQFRFMKYGSTWTCLTYVTRSEDIIGTLINVNDSVFLSRIIDEVETFLDARWTIGGY